MPNMYDGDIKFNLDLCGFHGMSVAEGRLMLLELMVKAAAGSRNSHTEEMFLTYMGVLKKDRTICSLARKWMCSMLYASSNQRAPVYDLIAAYRGALPPS